jgi:hypothetical protein
MKISGAYTLRLSRKRAYEALRDPAVLAKCIPGCESLDKTGEDEYAMKMKLALAAVSGQFEGKVKIVDSNPPSSFKLIVGGKGKIGHVKGEGLLTLAEQDGGSTQVSYDGDASVGGTIAAVGQRLIDSTAKMMIKRFFEKVAETAEAG